VTIRDGRVTGELPRRREPPLRVRRRRRPDPPRPRRPALGRASRAPPRSRSGRGMVVLRGTGAPGAAPDVAGAPRRRRRRGARSSSSTSAVASARAPRPWTPSPESPWR
jgi:hypothetical protein